MFITSCVEGKKLSISYLLNYDQDSYIPSCFKMNQDIPNIIKIQNLPVLKIAKRHHHTVKFKKHKTPNERGQGRPFTTNLNIQFVIHSSVCDLVYYLTKNLKFDILQFDNIIEIIPEFIPLIIDNFKNFNKPNGSILLQYYLSNLFQIFKPTVSSNKISASTNSKQMVIYEPQLIDDNLNDALESCLNTNFILVRVIRNNAGNLIKLETIDTPSIYNSEWFKRQICFPRYKSGMKIHIIKDFKFTKPIIVYKDLRMLIWDFQNIGAHYFKDKIISIVI